MKACSITVNSAGTRDKLKLLFSISTSYIVRPGVSLDFNGNDVKNLDKKYGFSRPYILAVATLEPRKNLTLLINSFIKLKREGFLKGYSLVLAGGQGWRDKKLKEVLARAKDEDLIYPVGYVSDEDLPSLYRQAELFVFPSVYEGFGMPILEARASGARVLASNIPEHKEAGGRFISYFELGDIEYLSTAILRALDDAKSLKSFELSSNAELFEKCSWEVSAKILATALRECL
jgi:glycosyltransferase involved in cell wall biosynthesis